MTTHRETPPAAISIAAFRASVLLLQDQTRSPCTLCFRRLSCRLLGHLAGRRPSAGSRDARRCHVTLVSISTSCRMLVSGLLVGAIFCLCRVNVFLPSVF